MPIQPGIRRYRAASLAIAGCILFTSLTLPRFFADSRLYALDIRNFDQPLPIEAWGMWDFGHLAWRWIGYGLFHAAPLLWNSLEPAGSMQAYYLPLALLSWFGTCAALYLTLRCIELYDQSLTTAIVSTVGFLGINSVLNNLQAGTAYMPGLAFSTAVILVMAQPGRDLGSVTAIRTGLMLAMSVALWFPFIVTVPAILLTPFLLNPPAADQNRLRVRTFIIRCAIAAALFGTLFYIVAIVSLHAYSLERLKDWIAFASHGWSQNQRVVRFLFGFPGSFFYRGSDGVLFKRYLLHDPYAPVRAWELFRGSLFNVAMSFGYLGLLLFALLRRPDRRPLLWFCSALAPLVAFAILVFEPSSIERYLPLLPFLMVSAVLASKGAGRVMKPASAVALACLLGSNLPAHWRPTVLNEYAAAEKRAILLRGRVTPSDLEFVVNQFDPLNSLQMSYVFHEFNRNSTLHTEQIAEIAVNNIAVWRQNFGRLVENTWSQNGQVWISKRLLAERPAPSWQWTEGDDKRIRWADIPAFFSDLDLSESLGEDDGFVLFPKTAKNESRMKSLAADWRPVY